MTALTRSQVEAWAKLAEQATPGPWERTDQSDSVWALPDWIQVAHCMSRPGVGMLHDPIQIKANSILIAASRTAVPALAADWIAQREEIERANEYVIGEQYTSDTVTNPIDALIEIATERGKQYEQIQDQLAALRKVAEAARERLRAYSDGPRMDGYCTPGWRPLRDALTALAEKEKSDA